MRGVEPEVHLRVPTTLRVLGILALTGAAALVLALIVGVVLSPVPIGSFVGGVGAVVLGLGPFIWGAGWLAFSRVDADEDEVFIVSWGCHKEHVPWRDVESIKIDADPLRETRGHIQLFLKGFDPLAPLSCWSCLPLPLEWPWVCHREIQELRDISARLERLRTSTLEHSPAGAAPTLPILG